MKIFITGSRGNVASSIIPKLKENSHQITNFDISDNPEFDIINNYEKLSKMMADHDMVIHLAAIPHPDRHRSFYDYYNINSIGTFNILEAAVANKVQRVIYSSSTAYYGFTGLLKGKLNPDKFPLDENHRPMPTGPYAMSKAVSDLMCQMYGNMKVAQDEWQGITKDNLIETIIIRLGPLEPETGFDWKASWIPLCLWSCIGRENMAQAFSLAVEAKDNTIGAFNFTDEFVPEEACNIQEWVKENYPGVPIKTKGNESLIDITKAKKILGYKPIK